MTNEQAKQEAIKKAWEALGINNLRDADKNGFIADWKFSVDFFNQHESKIERYKIDGLELIRPLSISGIEDNNGWIRIEPDGSNLPVLGKYKWILGSDLIYEETFDPKNPTHVKEFLYAYTHYKPITPELKRIY